MRRRKDSGGGVSERGIEEKISEVRAKIAYLLGVAMGIPMAEIARQVGVYRKGKEGGK